MLILYSAIARHDTILVSYQSDQCPVNFDDLLKIGMSEVSAATNTQHVVTVGNNLLLHIIIDDKLLYACIAEPEAGRWLPVQFLTEVIQIFKNSSLSSRAQFAALHEFSDSFARILADQMIRYSCGKGGDRISRLKGQVEDVRGVINENIAKVMDRGDILDDLLTKTQHLEETAVKFRTNSKRVQSRVRCKNMKMLITLIVIGTSTVTLAVLFAIGIIPTS